VKKILLYSFKFLLSLVSYKLSLTLCWAAPYPATSSSSLTDPSKGFFLLHKGFTLKAAQDTWIPLESETSSYNETIRYFLKENPEGPMLSVKTDRVAKNASLNLYTRKWLKEYPGFGFDILASKTYSLNNQHALSVDLISRAKGKQIQQVIFKNADKVAILTCMDTIENFEKSLERCHEFIDTFIWNEDVLRTNSQK
jgi:hypothetical protein